MTGRRAFLAGLLASGFAPRASWAEAGSPALLSAGRRRDGSYVLCGLTAEGVRTFTAPLPARGHASAAHPLRAEAIIFARRPGRFALALECVTGRNIAQFSPPEGRHFYGHGVFSSDGTRLFTTENDYERARGVIGVWDVADGYRRMGEFPSGGIGPHDIKLMPDGRTLVIANGGIETHPDAGRAKLNLPTMASNLSYVTLDGQPLEQMSLPPEHQRNSIRHLAVAGDGRVGFAMQWQGEAGADVPLLGVHQMTSQQVQLFEETSAKRMQGYLGSIAMRSDGQALATTSPREGGAHIHDRTGQLTEIEMADVCGVAAVQGGFVLTAGTGVIRTASGGQVRGDIAWDNHIVSI